MEILKLLNGVDVIDIIYINVGIIECEIIEELAISNIPSLYIYDPACPEPLDKNNVLLSSDISKVKEYLQDNDILVNDDLKFDSDDF